MRLLAIALLLLSGLALAAEPPPRAGTDYALDGLRLGDTFAQAAAKAPWSSPCDQDPVADKARRAVIYGTKRCPKAPFPGNTNAVLFLAFRADPKEAAPIEAMAWLGGNYFDSRSDFPVALGTKLPDGKAAHLAAALENPAGPDMTIRWRGRELHVTRFGEDIYIIDDGKVVAGAVIGRMPTDPANEQWRLLAQVWARHVEE